MNQSLEEEKIRRLFRELRRADERLAPPFARVFEAASSQTGKANQPRFVFRLAAVAVALIALICAGLIFFNRSPGLLVRSESARPIKPLPVLKDAASRAELPEKVSTNRERRTRTARQRQSLVAISEWRSPTSFLLKNHGDEWLMDIPRLDESIVQIKPTVPEELR